MMKLYCPECSNYLGGGDGAMHDCRSCGWKQPTEPVETECQGLENLANELAEGMLDNGIEVVTVTLYGRLYTLELVPYYEEDYE